MSDNLIHLSRVEPIRYPEDVARLRAILNARGFDASDADIQWAYREYSEDYRAASWIGLDEGDGSDNRLFGAIREYLREAGTL